MQLLTKREREVVQLLSRGLTYQKMALKMDVSHETVKMHLKNIYRKLRVQNKIEALQKVKLL
jgi:two-component system, NarL family, response regulator LiaR